MLKIKFTILLFTIAMSSIFAQNSDDIIGKYHLPNKLDIEIFKKNGNYFGKIIALNGYENGQTTDFKNPDKSKQKRKLLGLVIIKNLEYDSKNKEWINGTMYGPEKGVLFNLEVTEMRKKEIVVVGSKYIFWHTLIWKKLATTQQ